ncbi:MAG: N4-gp56 family major capsid protein [Oscillospiraceae bacterium]|nr:N4-gp56 family major capsid protein [Oscillospiraceae bacterium]
MKKIFAFNLQWFAEAGTLVNSTVGYRNAYTGDLTQFDTDYTLESQNKTYFDTTLLDNARDQLIFAQLGKKQPLPANHGRTIEFRRWKTLGRVSQLTEGVIPTGKKMSQVAITCSLTQWGDYVTISDILDIHAIDDVTTGAVEELGAAAGLTNDLLVRNVLLGGTQILFADAYDGSSYVSTPANKAALLTALGSYTCNLTPRMINKAVTMLKKSAKNKRYTGMYYVAVIHPDVAEDLRNDPAWIESHKYAAVEEIFTGEIGRMHGVRFVESNIAPVIKEDGDSKATFKTMFFAKDAFAVIDAEGGGMETIIKSRKEIGGPLEQFGTVGTKFEMTAKILYQERMVTVWSGSSYSATEEQNITEAA